MGLINDHNVGRCSGGYQRAINHEGGLRLEGSMVTWFLELRTEISLGGEEEQQPTMETALLNTLQHHVQH